MLVHDGELFMIDYLIESIASWTNGWLLISYVLAISLLCTIILKGIQFRYFFTAWVYMLFPKKAETIPVSMPEEGMTPLQAFINTLSANLGNGSIAGVATAIFSGGPGAAFWVLAAGFLLMAVRMAEVYLSIYYGSLGNERNGLGGPMLYLRTVAGGKFLGSCYAVLCLLLAYLMGNALQTNSIRISLVRTWNIEPLIIACGLFLLVLYIVSGGAPRIVKISATIVPFKVMLFFSTIFVVLAYHMHTLVDAGMLIIQSALHPAAIAGGVFGFTVQQAMRYGITRSIFATESGLGTAAILYGSTGSKEAVKVSIMSMLSTFISTLACFLVALAIVASGVWNSGLTSSALTIAMFETVFGVYAGWIVSFLSLSFGIGVMVVFAYIARETWLYLTGNRFNAFFNASYCLVAVVGVLTDVTLLWTMSDILIACMLLINLFGIVCLLPVIVRGMNMFEGKK